MQRLSPIYASETRGGVRHREVEVLAKTIEVGFFSMAAVL